MTSGRVVIGRERWLVRVILVLSQPRHGKNLCHCECLVWHGDHCERQTNFVVWTWPPKFNVNNTLEIYWNDSLCLILSAVHRGRNPETFFRTAFRWRETVHVALSLILTGDSSASVCKHISHTALLSQMPVFHIYTKLNLTVDLHSKNQCVYFRFSACTMYRLQSWVKWVSCQEWNVCNSYIPDIVTCELPQLFFFLLSVSVQCIFSEILSIDEYFGFALCVWLCAWGFGYYVVFQCVWCGTHFECACFCEVWLQCFNRNKKKHETNPEWLIWKARRETRLTPLTQ